nr:SUMF1/EgtB/PvdO family nonheme iron enzyme [uncultured Novosphingobium sp.]
MKTLSITFGLIALGWANSPARAQFHGMGWSHSPLQAVQAARGDRNALLELGKRYETGEGLAKDVKEAKRLYRAAASRNSIKRPVYFPGVPGYASARVSVDRGRTQPRLIEAETRLAAPENEVRMPDVVRPKSFRDCPECVSISLVRSGDPSMKSFYMATYETSWREYLVAVKEAGCALPTNFQRSPIASADSLGDNYAVSGITYNDALCFVGWLSGKSLRPYRLPTPDEWRLAAKTATISSPYEDPTRTDLGDDPRRGVRSMGARIVEHGQPSFDGIFGLRDGVGEMTSLETQGPPSLCRAYKKDRCSQIYFIGHSSTGSAQETDRLDTAESTEASVDIGFRVVRDN